MTVPALRADGLRDTPMRDIDDNEKLWYFRSAFNVAALNCQSPQHFRIADDYNLFLKTHKRELDRINKIVEDILSQALWHRLCPHPRYRKHAGLQLLRLPADQVRLLRRRAGAGPGSCSLAIQRAGRASRARALPQLEGVFERFYASYENYQTDLQKWIALYGSPEMRAAQAGQQQGTIQSVSNPSTTTPTSAPPVLPTTLPTTGPFSGAADRLNLRRIPRRDQSTRDPVPDVDPLARRASRWCRSHFRRCRLGHQRLVLIGARDHIVADAVDLRLGHHRGEADHAVVLQRAAMDDRLPVFRAGKRA